MSWKLLLLFSSSLIFTHLTMAAPYIIGCRFDLDNTDLAAGTRNTVVGGVSDLTKEVLAQELWPLKYTADHVYHMVVEKEIFPNINVKLEVYANNPEGFYVQNTVHLSIQDKVSGNVFKTTPYGFTSKVVRGKLVHKKSSFVPGYMLNNVSFAFPNLQTYQSDKTGETYTFNEFTAYCGLIDKAKENIGFY